MAMRFVVFTLALSGLLTLPLSANGEEALRFVGAGVVSAKSPYRGVGTNAMAVPVVVVDHKNFYIKGVEVGYHCYVKDHLTLSVMTAPRFMGYHSGDSDDLIGMQDRRMSADAGLRAELKPPVVGDFVLSVGVVTDVSSTHEGQEYELSLSRKFSGKYFQLMPTCGIRYQSERMVDYYYGVRSGEVSSGRPEYEPEGAVNYFGQVFFNFGISKDWIVVTRAGVEFLGSEIKKSPIVSEDHLWMAVIGLTRRF